MDSADALLVQLAAADAARRPDRTPFLFTKTGGMNQQVSHPGLPDDEIPCSEADVLDLEDRGYVRMTQRGGGTLFDVTPEGLRRAAQLDLANAAVTGGRVAEHALDWDTVVFPVLQAVERVYSHAPNSMGVRSEDVAAELGADVGETALYLDELVRASYLEETAQMDQFPGPAWVRLAEKGLQVTAGWPSASARSRSSGCWR